MSVIETYERLRFTGHGDWDEINSAWEQICSRFPSLFSGNDIGTQVGVGWWNPLEEGFERLAEVLSSYPPEVRFSVLQIKEKFGQLRFYYTLSEAAPDDLRQVVCSIVCEIERKADTMCEVCGEPGHRDGRTWIRTMCDKHHRAQNRRERARNRL